MQERPQVSSPMPYGSAIVKVHTVKGTEEVIGTRYLFPGFEQFDLVLLKPRGNRQKATKQFWRILEAETGYRIAEAYSDEKTPNSTIEQANNFLNALGKQRLTDRLAQVQTIIQRQSVKPHQ